MMIAEHIKNWQEQVQTLDYGRRKAKRKMRTDAVATKNSDAIQVVNRPSGDDDLGLNLRKGSAQLRYGSAITDYPQGNNSERNNVLGKDVGEMPNTVMCFTILQIGIFAGTVSLVLFLFVFLSIVVCCKLKARTKPYVNNFHAPEWWNMMSSSSQCRSDGYRMTRTSSSTESFLTAGRTLNGTQNKPSRLNNINSIPSPDVCLYTDISSSSLSDIVDDNV